MANVAGMYAMGLNARAAMVTSPRQHPPQDNSGRSVVKSIVAGLLRRFMLARVLAG
ncbi:MAG: hypothetical protein AAGB02_04970 [Pseudomonadota bacterium]